jgi:tetratricopeptide (TPR) repeat protein
MRCLAALLCALSAFAITPEVERHFLAAQQAQANRDLATAEKEYKEVLRLDPRFAEAHLNLGLMYQTFGRISQAMDEFHAALKLKPNLAGAKFFLGIDYAKRGDGISAVPYLAAASEEQPGNIDVLYLLGQAYERLGKAEAAGLKKTLSGSVRGEQLVAESYATSNDWASAVIHFQNVLAKAPNVLGIHLQLGEVYLHAGRIKPARAEFQQELYQDPASVRSRVRLGEAKLLDGDTKGALEDWSVALAIDRVQVERVLGLSESHPGDAAAEQFPEAIEKRLDEVTEELSGNDTNAAQLARAFCELQKGKGSAYLKAPVPSRCAGNIASLLQHEQYGALRPCAKEVPLAMRLDAVSGLFAVGEYDQALWLLDTLPASRKLSLDARYWRGRCYEKLATAAYVQMYQADPNSYRVHELFGDLAVTRDNDGKSVEEYRTALTLSPNSPELHYKLGHVLWKDSNVPDARDQFVQELKINPNHAGALHELGETYLLEHQPNDALPYLQRALELDGDDPDIHRDLGTAYAQLEEYAKAEPEFRLAIAGDHDGSVHYKLANVYKALGQKANADREFAIYRTMSRSTHEKLEEQGQRLSDITRIPQ